MSLVSDNSSSMATAMVKEEASEVTVDIFTLLDFCQKSELPSFDSISQPSDNSSHSRRYFLNRSHSAHVCMKEMDSVNMAGVLMLCSRGSGEERRSPSCRVFECKTCNRQFQSFQALGGHRASHKKGHRAVPKKPMQEVHDYTDLEWAWTTPFSFGQASSNGGISTLGDQSHPTLGGNRMSEQDAAKLKSFDKFSQWATALFFAILIGLLAVNAKQAQFLFRSCSTLVFGATISGIAMLLLVLMGHSSRRILTSLKMLQYLIIGLLFITAIQVYMFTLK